MKKRQFIFSKYYPTPLSRAVASSSSNGERTDGTVVAGLQNVPEDDDSDFDDMPITKRQRRLANRCGYNNFSNCKVVFNINSNERNDE